MWAGGGACSILERVSERIHRGPTQRSRSVGRLALDSVEVGYARDFPRVSDSGVCRTEGLEVCPARRVHRREGWNMGRPQGSTHLPISLPYGSRAGLLPTV